jgi:hypothetical protein
MHAKMAKELVFSFPDLVGVYAKTGRELANAGINVSGILNVSHGTSTITHMALSGNISQARAILQQNGATDIHEHDILAVTLPSKPGALAEVAEKLAPAGINIGDLYASEVPGSNTTVYVQTSDNQKALKVLGG